MRQNKFAPLTSLILLGSFFLFSKTLAANNDIVINEIGAYPTSTHEWIEIWNKGNEPIDLTGWKFWENNTNHGLSVSTTDAIVSPGEYAVIVQDDKQFILDFPSFSGSIFDSSWSILNESGEEIGLKDNIGNFIEKFTYISAASYSLERKNPFLADYTSTNWHDNATGNTVGFINSNFSVESSTPPPPTDTTSTTSTYSIWSQIKINEFIPDPVNGDEWIELYNTGTSSLDLAGSLLCDSRASESCAIASPTGTIASGGWLTIYLSGSRLNNDGDSVLLKNPTGEIIDRVDYSGGGLLRDGRSLARVSDGVDSDNDSDWAISDTPTPGTANIITTPPTPSPMVGGGSGNSDYFSALLQTKTEQSTSTKGGSASGGKKNAKETVTISWNVSYPARISQNSSTIFDARRSADPRGGEIMFTWNFGDGSEAEGGLISHTFSAPGIFIVTVRATSTQGTVGQKNFTVKAGPSESLIFLREILVRPGEDEDEVVTIGTLATNTVELSGYRIGTASDRWFTIPLNTFLRPNGILRFFKTITHLSLVDGGGSVLLANPSGIVVDIIDYGKVKRGEVVSDEPIAENTTTIARPISNYSFLPIESAIDQPVGTLTTVAGAVLSLPGEPFANYFYLRDGVSVIQIYSYKKDFPRLALGDRVRVFGEISSANGQPRLKTKSAANITRLPGTEILKSETKTIADVDEADFGTILTLRGEITKLKSGYFYLDDSSAETRVSLGTSIDKAGLQNGTNLTVTGIVEKIPGGWRLVPRSSADLTIDDRIPPTTYNLQPTTSTTKVAVGTGGGLTLLGLAWGVRKLFIKYTT